MQFRSRSYLPLALATLFLAACSQLSPTPTTSPQGAAGTQMPLPEFSSTFSGNTRGFWFEAPVGFRITGLRVPDEAGRGLQNVEVFKLSSEPPAYPDTASGGQVFYKTGVASGEIIPTNLAFAKGDFVGILGAAGDTSAMSNSYGSGDFSSDVLGEPVTLKRFLTQTNIVSSGGNQPYSSEAGGSIARVEVYVAALETTLPTVSLTTPLDGASYQQGEAVTAAYTCSDEEGGSGLKSCSGTLENDSTLDTTTPGSYSFKVDAEDNAGNTASVTHRYMVEVAPPPPATAYPYTIDFERTPTNRLVQSVKLGSGVIYGGAGTSSNATVPIVGKRHIRGKILEGQQAKVVSLYGSKRLTVVSAGTNTPASQGGRIKLTFTNFDPAGATLTSLTLSNLTSRGAFLTFYYVNGTSSKQTLGTTARGGSLVVPLDIEGLRAVDIYAPNAYTVDDVDFEVPAPVAVNPCRTSVARC